MTINEAKKERDSYSHLIGKTLWAGSLKVTDVIVTPDTNFGDFIEKYLEFRERLSNDDLIDGFSSKEFSVYLCTFLKELNQSLMLSLNEYLKQIHRVYDSD